MRALYSPTTITLPRAAIIKLTSRATVMKSPALNLNDIVAMVFK